MFNYSKATTASVLSEICVNTASKLIIFAITAGRYGNKVGKVKRGAKDAKFSVRTRADVHSR